MQDSKINIRNEIFHLLITSLEKKRDVENVDRAKQLWTLYSRKEVGLCNYQSHFSQWRAKVTDDVSGPEGLYQDMNSNQIQQERADVSSMWLIPKFYNEHDLQHICRILMSSMDWSSMQESLEKCTVIFTPELVLEVLFSFQLHGLAALRFFSWVDQRPGYKNTTETYNMVIKISGSAKVFEHMRKLYHEMKRKRIVITSKTWSIMIMQYGRAGLTEIALKKFKEMKAEGFIPSGSTYKYLVVFLCGRKGRKVDEAIRIFHEMINAGHVPDRELAEIYLQCLCETDNFSDATRCIKSLYKCGFKPPLSYSLVIRALCRAGRLEAALVLADEMGEAPSTLDQYIFWKPSWITKVGKVGGSLSQG